MADEVKLDVKWAIALLIASMLAFSAMLGQMHAAPNDWWTPYDTYGGHGEENLTALTGQLLSGSPDSPYSAAEGTSRAPMPLLAPFEILSILLLVALIGSIAVAAREPEDTPPRRPGGMR